MTSALRRAPRRWVAAVASGLCLAVLGLAGFGPGGAAQARSSYDSVVAFDPSTHTMSVLGQLNIVNHITVRPSPDFHGWVEITDKHTPNFAGPNPYCGPDPRGHGWACEQVQKVLVEAGGGNDTITVSLKLTIPTLLEGDAGKDSITAGGGPSTIWGACDPQERYCVTPDSKAPDGIRGGPANDVIHGAGGNDQLLDGDGGNDTIYGGGGDDYISGSFGDDTLFGGPGNDVLDGNKGTDVVDYSDRTAPVSVTLDNYGNDGVAGEKDNIYPSVEVVVGGSGADHLVGNGRANVFRGGPGNDRLEGKGGNDILKGQSGDDVLDGGAGADDLSGGDGFDTATWENRAAKVTATLDGQANDGVAGEHDLVETDVEGLAGGNGPDRLVGNSGRNGLAGGPGNDVLDGNGDSGQDCCDSLAGGPGDDTLMGGPPGSTGDALDGGPGTDVASYASRTEGLTIVLQFAGGEDVITNVENARGGSGDDQLAGSSGDNLLTGGPGNDLLVGEEGNDTLEGGAGDDTLEGGDGADVLRGGAGRDLALYKGSPGPVTVTLDGAANDGVSGEGDNVRADVEDVRGSQYNDSILGDSAANRLYGGEGDDLLKGFQGDDLLDGGPGNDTADGGAGADQCPNDETTQSC